MQDDLRAAPQETLMRACEYLDVDPTDLSFRQYFHTKADTSDTKDYSPSLLDEANQLYERISQLALR